MVAMKTVNVHDAKTHFSSLLARVEQKSECIVICRNGEPVANLVPHKPRKRTRVHAQLSKIKLNYDPVEPLGKDEWPEASR
jgi:prevent-host-death family protein